MSCQSTRTIYSQNPKSGQRPPEGVEEVQCVKPQNHPGQWHEGILEDLTGIQWIGSPSADVPQAIIPRQVWDE